MAFSGLSSQTLNYARICFLLSCAFFVLKDPTAVCRYSMLVLLAGSFKLPLVNLEPQDPRNGVISLFLLMLAVSDLVPLLESNVQYFESVVPTRVLILFTLAGFCYFSSSIYVANSLVFGYVFMEIWFSLMIFSSLRDEKFQRMKKLSEKIQTAEEEDDDEYQRIVHDVHERSEQSGL
ncbi:unnamed protein product [Kuraishia capsulata CBS 1993]|uniref:Protein ILM1 n=1 Tax=Kuraishia capsulata CBS 1993 TaxID=1382522 RepID=W6MRK8_9ASCO|nr:uncharacterized protein KUCA_T00005337001 [Kuraishia capsulata CBS 1993]CDK29349.1 unnamed protein product [Kuraishia capsulata CBS 1993]